MTTADIKKNELILELTQKIDKKNEIIKEQLEVIKMLSKQLNLK